MLDEVEDVVGGEYSRLKVRTGRGLDAWAYAYGSGLDLTPDPLRRLAPAPPPPLTTQ